MVSHIGSVSEIVRNHSTNPNGLVVLLDSAKNPAHAIQLYQEGNKAGVLRPIDHEYLSKYAQHPEVRTAADINRYTNTHY